MVNKLTVTLTSLVYSCIVGLLVAIACMITTMVIYVGNFNGSPGGFCAELDSNDDRALSTSSSLAITFGAVSLVSAMAYYHLARKWAVVWNSSSTIPDLPSLWNLLAMMPRVFKLELLLIIVYLFITMMALVDSEWRAYAGDNPIVITITLFYAASMILRLIGDYSYRMGKSYILLTLGGVINILVYVTVKMKASQCEVASVSVWLGLRLYEIVTLVIAIANLKFVIFRLPRVHHKEHRNYFNVIFIPLYEDVPDCVV